MSVKMLGIITGIKLKTIVVANPFPIPINPTPALKLVMDIQPPTPTPANPANAAIKKVSNGFELCSSTVCLSYSCQGNQVYYCKNK